MRNILLIGLLFIFSCKKEESIEIGHFEKIPAVIDGCSEIYQSVESGKTVYVSNLQDFIAIHVDGRKVHLKKINDPINSDENYKTRAYGEGYSARLDVRKVKQVDMSNQYEGTLTITNGTAKKVIKVKGEVGC